MQKSVTELSQRLLRSLDNNYNVIDMPAVFEIISALDHTSITEELLKTTRLGKYINELRRKTNNETLAKRAKELLKKWRGQVLPSAAVSNGTTTPKVTRVATPQATPHPSPITAATINQAVSNKKRPLSSLSIDDSSNSNKRIKHNGTSELLYISDNSNSCDVKKNQNYNPLDTLSFAGRVTEPPPAPLPPEPKKRGRKKGSKNHKTLLVQAEESFTNKMAVSVNAKVKTTQELLASIQNKNLVRTNNIKKEVIESPKVKIQPAAESDDDIIEIIDPVKVEEESIVKKEEIKEEVIIVEEEEDEEEQKKEGLKETQDPKEETVEDILRKLPKVDYSQLDVKSTEPECSCIEPEPSHITIAFSESSSIFDVPESQSSSSVIRTSEAFIDPECPARAYYQNLYKLGPEYVTDVRVNQLHTQYLDKINGNKCDKTANTNCDLNNGLYSNIVPNFYENLRKDINFSSKSVTEERTIKCCDVDPYLPSKSEQPESSPSLSSPLDNQSSSSLCDQSKNDTQLPITRDYFREFHECVSLRTYNDELLHILPYVVLD